MANEITVNVNLSIKKGNLVYQSPRPTAFKADMASGVGPSPGVVLVPTHGVSITFDELNAMGGVCWMCNLDEEYRVTYGILDNITHKFYPLGEILPGESYAIRLSRLLGEDYGTGSGTSGESGGDFLHFKAAVQPCYARIEAFDP